jgi:hypothetical protein
MCWPDSPDSCRIKIRGTAGQGGCLLLYRKKWHRLLALRVRLSVTTSHCDPLFLGSSNSELISLFLNNRAQPPQRKTPPAQ